jgi:alcohol dehydrogenase (cytochrome c)
MIASGIGTKRQAVIVALIVGSSLVAAQEKAPAGLTPQEIAHGYQTPTRWPTYSGDYSGQRHTPLTQITPANAHRLSARWTFQT